MLDNKKWVWVCVQHPMPLLVQDRGEPKVLERIPPWGDPDLSSYVQKFNDVFDSIEKYPDFRMDFEISARELEDFFAAAPDSAKRMIELVKKDRIGLIGGDYSQAHYHVYGAESCIRQIDIGLKIFKEHFNYDIDIFFHQETGLHEQLPQILNAFGYKIAVPPRFPWALQFVEGNIPELSTHYGTVEFVNGEEFTKWIGLDGSEIPLYLYIPAPSQSDEIVEVFQKHGNPEVKKEIFEGGPSPYDQFMERERQKNPVTVPPILIENPDMKRLDEEYYTKRKSHCRFSKMGDALKERLSLNKLNSKARLYAYWSYIEGVWAEKLSRTNKKAEQAAIQSETLFWMAELITGKKHNNDYRIFNEIWKKILSSQHHDVYWIETTDLKNKAVKWLENAIQQSSEIMKSSIELITNSVNTNSSVSDKVLVLFNSCPHRRSGIIKTEISGLHLRPCRLLSSENRETDTQIVTLNSGEETIAQFLFCDTAIPGLGYSSYSIVSKEKYNHSNVVESNKFIFENKIYKSIINGDGTFDSIIYKDTNTELLSTETKKGNEISGFKDNDTWLGNRNANKNGIYEEGKFIDTLYSEYYLGPIKTWQHILFYHDSGRIDFFLTLDFGMDGVSIGDFWEDFTKLNVYWPLNTITEVYYDIPFGVVEAKEHRPLYCSNWIDCSGKSAGISYFNKGTTKHRIEGNTLFNIIAWGGNHFSNRHPGIWEYVRKYDLNLYGKHTIEYSIMIHSGNWKDGNVPINAQYISNPVIPNISKRTTGNLNPQHGILELETHSIIGSAVTKNKKGIPHLRAFESYGKKVELKELKLSGNLTKKINAFRGEQIQNINPWQIIEIQLEAEKRNNIGK